MGEGEGKEKGREEGRGVLRVEKAERGNDRRGERCGRDEERGD
jgi:hypothetical protein